MHSRFPISADQIVERNDKLARQLKAVLYQIEHMHETPWLLFVCGKRDWPFKVSPEERVGLARLVAAPLRLRLASRSL